jgi:hypothetical protein
VDSPALDRRHVETQALPLCVRCFEVFDHEIEGRVGHAHAGVLLVLSLVYFLFLANNTDFGDSTQWVAGAILLGGVLTQSGGFFLHLAVGESGRGSIGTRLTRSGALLIALALVILAIGIGRA